MRIYTTSLFDRTLRRITKKNFKLLTEIKFALSLLTLDHNDQRLKKHKLESRKTQDWSISVNQKIRIIFYYDGDDIVLTNIGSHDEVY